jgi:formate dehydrogenase maturation protein FdhE
VTIAPAKKSVNPQTLIASAELLRKITCLDNCTMAVSSWQRRIHRAKELIGQHAFAAEILTFYLHIAHFQQDLHRRLGLVLQSPRGSIGLELSETELSELRPRFDSFLSLAETHGPKTLAKLSGELRSRDSNSQSELLNNIWMALSPSDATGFLVQAFLQPYAELLRSRVSVRSIESAESARGFCPYCSHRPVAGVLRQMGDGAARSLICSFCLHEWEFRRLVCPACGEENDRKLPVFTAGDFDYIRVECCDACKTYIKTVDLTKNGHAEPVVDELASAPLDLWARDHGYAKVQQNLLGM